MAQVRQLEAGRIYMTDIGPVKMIEINGELEAEWAGEEWEALKASIRKAHRDDPSHDMGLDTDGWCTACRKMEDEQ